ncbi:MAG: CYTH domain-containing protein [Clostridia bacterium]|nr:CYTH domain-containing protein [Clostridia bacterium]
MEIELKYLVSSGIAQEIFADLKDSLSDEKVLPMHAVYFDTLSRDLRKAHMAVRVRKEGDGLVATCKWGGGSKDGLHKRNEVNVKLPLKEIPNGVFRELFIGSAAYDVIGTDENLEKLVEMQFVRREFHLNLGETTAVISYDEGKINENVPISELEIELLQGKEEDIVEFGAKLEEKYQISPCNVSKLARGLMNE